MGAYKAAVVTAGGQNLIAQALADNKALEFTSAKTSSHIYPSGTNIAGLTELQDVEQSTVPFASQELHGNIAQVSVRFDNDGVAQQYQINTIGLYAKVEGGEEALFSVIQAVTPDEMPVQSEVSPSAFIYNIQHTVQNAAQITIVVNPAGTATVQDIYNIENPAFDDSGAVEGITGFPDFLGTVTSKMNLFQFFRNLKAGMKFVLHAGQVVNNCMSDAADLPLAAAQGKALMELYTKLNSDFAGTNVKQYINLSNEEEIEQQIVKYSGSPGFYVVSTNEPKAHPEFNYSSGFFICRTNTYTLVIFSYDTGTIYIQSGYAANDGYHWSGWHRFVGS